MPRAVEFRAEVYEIRADNKKFSISVKHSHPDGGCAGASFKVRDNSPILLMAFEFEGLCKTVTALDEGVEDSADLGVFAREKVGSEGDRRHKISFLQEIDFDVQRGGDGALQNLTVQTYDRFSGGPSVALSPSDLALLREAANAALKNEKDRLSEGIHVDDSHWRESLA